MSTVAYRAALVREIEQSMKRIHDNNPGFMLDGYGRADGQLDAYAHILLLLKDEDL